MPNRLRLVMASEHANLEEAVERAETFFSSHLDDEDLIYNLVLLTSEAVTNGMEHGNHFDPNRSVIIEFSVNAQMAEIVVEDQGPGFRRDTVPDPLTEEHLFDAGGRGLFLLEHLADEVRYELDGRRTRVIFRRTV